MESKEEESCYSMTNDQKNKERFQDSPVRVSSKDTESGRKGINLAVKQAKPNNAGPILIFPKQSSKGSPMKRNKKPTVQEARRTKAALAANKEQATQNASSGPSSKKTCESTPTTQLKLQEINCQTSPKAILEAFQNQDMTTDEWEKMAGQVLTRGFQKTAEIILKTREEEPNNDSQLDTTPGFSDESGRDEHQRNTTQVRRSNRQTKNQGPKRYGETVKHSVHLICSEDKITDLNMAALEAYRLKVAKFKADNNNAAESSNNLYSALFFNLP